MGLARYWVEFPPVHVSVATYIKALAKEGPHGIADTPLIDPATIDWTTDRTTARKPTEAEIRAFAEQH